MNDDQQNPMKTQCLICASTAVIDRHMARSLILAVGAVQALLQGWKHAQDQETSAQGLLQVLDRARQAVEQEIPALQSFIADVERYQFAGFDCLCLRCGARFDVMDDSAVQPVSQ